MNIYNYLDYVEYLKDMIKNNAKTRGYQSRLAEIAKIHTSYLSKVLSGSVHLTVDQAVLMGEFWHLSQEEQEYLITLVNYARSAVPTLRRLLLKQLETYKKNHDDLSKRLKDAKVISVEKQSLYYSLWYYSAIHMLVMIPEFQSVDQLSLRLHLDASVILSALEFLQDIGLVKKEGGLWKISENDLHLSNSAMHANLYHANWRQRTSFHLLNNLKTTPDTEELHFSSLYAISKKDFKHIKNQFMDLIEKSRKQAQNSKEEDVYFFSVDSFKL